MAYHVRMRRALIVLVPLLALPGCFEREGAGACRELVDTYAARLVECGEFATHAEAEAAIVANIAASTPERIESCDDIWGIRDRVSFRDECLPGIEALPCGSAALPVACDDQLLYE